MKQFNFQHVNSNSKKFTVTVIFFQKGTKWAPKRPTNTPIYYVKYIKEFWAFSNNFRLFQDFRRLLKTDEDVRRLTKMSEDIQEGKPKIEIHQRLFLVLPHLKEV